MAFVNASLLFGTLLVGVPILLHLVMRQQPKHLPKQQKRKDLNHG